MKNYYSNIDEVIKDLLIFNSKKYYNKESDKVINSCITKLKNSAEIGLDLVLLESFGIMHRSKYFKER